MHILILGITNSGKSNLAKRLAKNFAESGQNVIVYDPLKSNGWPQSAVKFSDPETFLNEIEKYQSAHVFIDEAKVLFDYDQVRAVNLLTQKRHKGMLIYLIAQRANMILPNARNMCSKVYSFRQNGSNAAILADEYHESFLVVKMLDANRFVFSDGFRSGQFELDYSAGLPPVFKNSK